MLGLPDDVRACLFDLDGVLTQTAAVHGAAWKEMFDAYLRQRAEAEGHPFVPFDPGADYQRYVDGMPRADGVRTFLASRGIVLPEGERDDPPGASTVNGLVDTVSCGAGVDGVLADRRDKVAGDCESVTRAR